jgi:hypothetical protein
VGYARSGDPDTSHDAAASINTAYVEGLVMSALEFFPEGATSIQLAKALGLTPWSISPRMKPLRQKGLVVDSGERRTGTSRRRSIVWQRVETLDDGLGD